VVVINRPSCDWVMLYGVYVLSLILP